MKTQNDPREARIANTKNAKMNAELTKFLNF